MIGRPTSRRARGALAGAVALSLLTSALVACAPAVSTPRGATTQPKTASTPRLPGSPAQSAGKPAVSIGPTDPSRTLAITLIVPGRAPQELNQTLAAIQDPHSPNYHHYLTPSEYAQRFGAAPEAQARVEAFLRANDLPITRRAQNGQFITTRGTVARIESLFGVTLRDYRTADHQQYYAPTGAPRIPAALQGAVTGILGLDSTPALHSAGPRSITRLASEPAPTAYTPTDLERLYDIGPLHSAGLDGSKQTIALAEIDSLDQHAVDVYDQTYGLTTTPVDHVGDTVEDSDTGETTLDIEVIHAIAPKAHLIAYTSRSPYDEIAQMVSKIVTDNRAQILSMSLGGCETYAQFHNSQALAAFDAAFKQAAAQGMSVLISSGDNGAFGCQRLNSGYDLSTSVPSDNPFVTSVGGTALFSAADGSYGYEAGWEGPLSVWGGGGGLSAVYKLPTWQVGPGVANQYSNGMRQEPDVSADADPMTGYQIYYEDGTCKGEDCWTPMGGTSAATPLWAALIALGNQQATAQKQKTLGFLNPALYQLASQATSPAPFHDVIQGGDLYYQATPGWDYATGLGTPDAAVLINDLLAMPRATAPSSGATPGATPGASPTATPSPTP